MKTPAKIVYAALLQEAFRLGAHKLTAEDVAQNAHGIGEETIENYLEGETAPANADRHDEFFNAVADTLRLKGSQRLDELDALRKKLSTAFERVVKERRPKVTKIAPASDNQVINRVLTSCMPAIDVFLDSAKYYGLDATDYFAQIGVIDPSWQGPATFLDVQAGHCEATTRALAAPPKMRNAPGYWGRRDVFDALRDEMDRFPEEFAAVAALRDSLAIVLSACGDLEKDLRAYWGMNHPCAKSPFFDTEQENSRRYQMYIEYRSYEVKELCRNPVYVAALRDLALKADSSAEKIIDLVQKASVERDREAIRRGISSDPSSF